MVSAAGPTYRFPNVTVMLGRLEEAGLVERRTNPADRRENFVELTRKAVACCGGSGKSTSSNWMASWRV